MKTGVSILSLFKGKEGRDVFKMFESISGIDRDLLKSCQKDYQGEVVFFAVDDAYQGKGVGKKLFRSLMAYMDTEHIQDVYLYTDTSCNYEFYENQGMTKRCEKGYTFDVNGRTEKMSFYIYDFRR